MADINTAFIPAKIRLTLQSIGSVHKAVQWAAEHNREFSVQTASYVLGWIFDLDVRNDERFEYFEELFNEPKTETTK